MTVLFIAAIVTPIIVLWLVERRYAWIKPIEISISWGVDLENEILTVFAVPEEFFENPRQGIIHMPRLPGKATLKRQAQESEGE